MNIFIQNKNAIIAEFIKVKSTPIFFMIVTAGLFIAFITFMAHYLDIHNAVGIGRNPWDRLLNGGSGMYAIFILCPLVILLVSALIFTEQRASAWKYLYTTPNNRSLFFFNKLIMILFFLAFSILVLFLCICFSGFILNIIFPEYEFSYYAPSIGKWFSKMRHVFISVLGIVGIQFFLCMNTKHFMVPLGVGLLGFVAGFILITTNQKIGLYNPFDFPMIVRDNGMVRYGHSKFVVSDLFNNVEFHSVLCFLLFVVLAFVLEMKKNIK